MAIQQEAGESLATSYPVVETFHKAEWYRKFIEDKIKSIQDSA